MIHYVHQIFGGGVITAIFKWHMEKLSHWIKPQPDEDSMRSHTSLLEIRVHRSTPGFDPPVGWVIHLYKEHNGGKHSREKTTTSLQQAGLVPTNTSADFGSHPHPKNTHNGQAPTRDFLHVHLLGPLHLSGSHTLWRRHYVNDPSHPAGMQ
jgi:hypothetical protein